MAYIILECDNCDRKNRVDESKLLYDLVESVEREMGAESTLEADIEVKCKCGSFITGTHRIYEYAGVQNHKEFVYE